MEYRNQIVGLIRFSLLTTGDFYPGFSGPEALAAFLFDPARLARRFALFEALTLPTLAAQRDRGFRCIVLTSQALPGPWVERLRALLAPHPWAELRLAEAGPHYQSIRAAFAALPTGGASHRTSFRLDDDDAVDLDYVARLRRLAERVQAVPEAPGPVGLGFNRGLYLDLSGRRPDLFDARERTPVSVGAAIVAPIAWPENVYLYNHRALAQFRCSWYDAENIVFLRSLHGDNKSKPHFSGSQREMTEAAARQALRERFGLRPGALRGLCAAPA